MDAGEFHINKGWPSNTFCTDFGSIIGDGVYPEPAPHANLEENLSAQAATSQTPYIHRIHVWYI